MSWPFTKMATSIFLFFIVALAMFTLLIGGSQAFFLYI